MPFSIGNHLSLNIPLVPGGDPGAVVIRTPARKEFLLSERGLLSGESRAVDFGAGVRYGDRPGLADCVLGDFPGEVYAEVIDPSGFGLRVSQRELPSGEARTSPEHFYFVFYGDAQRTFLCPEPWYGGPNSLNERRGTVELEPGGVFRWEMAIELI